APVDVVEQILSKLSAQSLLRLETAAKCFRLLTKHRWHQLKEDEVGFSWACLANERETDKWNYCFTKALGQYITQDLPKVLTFNEKKPCLRKNRAEAIRMNNKYRGLMDRLPYFRAYVNP